MSEEFVKSRVMSAKIDANVVVELSIFKIGGWNHPQLQEPKFFSIMYG